MKLIFLFVVTNLAVLALLSVVQVEAAVGHEITHVANGDMVTLALLQGVLNTFVIVLARLVGMSHPPLDERIAALQST